MKCDVTIIIIITIVTVCNTYRLCDIKTKQLHSVNVCTLFSDFRQFIKLGTAGLLLSLSLRYLLVLGLGSLQLLVGSFKVCQTPHAAIQQVLTRRREEGEEYRDKVEE